jgi:hypothetical protein
VIGLSGWVLAASAGVRVVSTERCVTDEAVALEVEAVVAPATLEKVDIEVTVTVDAVLVRLVDGASILWSKVASIGPQDCPAVPMLVARTVEQALAELPRRALGGNARPAEVQLAVRGAPLPVWPPRWSLLLLGSGPVGGRARWMGGLGLSTEAVRVSERVGADVVELAFRAGPGVDLGSGGQGVRLGAYVAAGPAWFVPIGVTPDLQTTLLPSVRAEGVAEWVPSSAIRVALVGSVPAVRYEFVESNAGVEALAPAWRLGLQLGVARVLRNRPRG